MRRSLRLLLAVAAGLAGTGAAADEDFSNPVSCEESDDLR
jgi:hypothetical protein